MLLWKIRKQTNLLSPPWVVHAPDGSYSGAYDTWRDAMKSTNIANRVEQWLHQRDPTEMR